ncbi:MAG: DEAD/DEAH box helicase family protein [Chloroflexota bacterium]
MPRKKINPKQASYLENNGKTAPAVPAIRQAVQAWAANGYPGATETSIRLLNFWFHSDHKLATGGLFRYNVAQQESMESLVYVFEVAKTRTQKDLFERFIPQEFAAEIRLPEYDDFARYCIKMATGSGKTKVMSLAIAWQYLNAVIEPNSAYARTFLIIAPNVIVFERLRTDFAGGRIFQLDPIIPSDMKRFWEMQYYMRGEAERASSLGAVYLANVQQLYADKEPENDEPDIMTSVLGSKPPATLEQVIDFRERIIERGDSPLMVINDEAHHTHDSNSTWNETIRSLHNAHPSKLSAQLDFSATPRFDSGALFPWIISDYTIKQAILEGIVKRPVKGVTDAEEILTDVAALRYEPFVTAGIERWREYRTQLAPLGKKPLLFIMMNNTSEADSIGYYLRTNYRDEFAGDKTLVIHTKNNGDIIKGDLDLARKAAREVDSDDSPVNAIVSVLMLREGWDVQNVTVVVGLRPYTSKADILPEQTIGRGLRLMFRNVQTTYQERVDIIGNKGFIRFVEELEKDEDIKFETYQVGKDKLVITVIEPVAERASFDIALPVLTPIIARITSLESEIEAIDVRAIQSPVIPVSADSKAAQTFRYEGMDILTLEKLFERTYNIPTPQTSQEIVSRYAQIIASDLRLPSQFAVLAPKIRDYLKYKAFGKEVDLDTPEILRAISRSFTAQITLKVFQKLLQDKLIKPQQATLENVGRPLSTIAPFPWSQLAPVCQKTVFNKVPCDNKFEEEFARFLDRSSDVLRFSKLPMNFGFTIPYSDTRSNLRHYYPDFAVVGQDGVHYLVETKGREDTDVVNKDRAATIWVNNATTLTEQTWQYLKVLQQDFNDMQPSTFDDCVTMGRLRPTLFD